MPETLRTGTRYEVEVRYQDSDLFGLAVTTRDLQEAKRYQKHFEVYSHIAACRIIVVHEERRVLPYHPKDLSPCKPSPEKNI